MPKKPNDPKSRPRRNSGKSRKRVGILCPGGASPATNTALYCVVRQLESRGCTAFGIPYYDLFSLGQQFWPLTADAVSGFVGLPGSLLGTARLNERVVKRNAKNAIEKIKRDRIDGLVVIGGSGSLQMVYRIMRDWDLPVVVIPKTVDNDIPGINPSLGFHSIVEGYAKQLQSIFHDSLSYADSQVIVFEVMGRNLGWIAVETGLEFVQNVEHISAQLPRNNYANETSCLATEFAGRVNRYFRLHAVLLPETGFVKRDLLAHLRDHRHEKLVCVLLAEGVKHTYEGDKRRQNEHQINEGVGAFLVRDLMEMVRKRDKRNIRARCIIPSIAGRAVSISHQDSELASLLAASAVEHLTNTTGKDKVIVGTWEGKLTRRTVANIVEDPGGKLAAASSELLYKRYSKLALLIRQDPNLVWWKWPPPN